MNQSQATWTKAMVAGLAATAMVGAALLAAAVPAVASTPTTGVWIFPHAKRTAALADSLDDTFYIGDSENPWLQDSFFADSLADSATVQVDLYNPTGSDLFNVQVFAAYSVDNLGLVESISFSGGVSGDLSYSGTDLQSGGTPQMTGGVAIDAHDIYPSYFVSYGVGDLDAGRAGILTFTITVVGDFANALIVHLDYTAEDADGNGVSGPFEADMNIFENGEADTCDLPTLTLAASPSTRTPAAGSDLVVRFRAGATGSDALVTDRAIAAQIEVTDPVSGAQIGEDGAAGVFVDDTGTDLNVTIPISPVLVAGDVIDIDATLTGTACGETLTATASLTVKVGGSASGDAHSADWWADQAEKTMKGKKQPAYSATEFALLLRKVALHSDIFTYGAWNGTAPTGGDDAGWVDIDTLSEAANVLNKKTDESKKVRGSEREDLALWLNVAAGAVNLDTQLEIYEKKHHCRGSHSEFEDHTGRKTLSSSYDTPSEILAFLETQIKDWSDGHGASKDQLKLARRLARSVNNEWLVAA